MSRAASLLVLLGVVGCGPPAQTAPTAQAAPAKKVGWQIAPAEGEIAPYVAKALTSAKQQNRQLLVYVGASWCEPCKRFHDAVAAGKLDATFPQLDLVEYDLDRDDQRLRSAGYASQYIPLFAKPLADGRGSGKQFAGSVKGEAAIGDLERKLTALLQN